ncbi:amidohydrolase family protein [Aspergillus undulatus]|uniref:amidohydrolase family protein n=1 Tax=Aspergillus undulatus TaxID=1810928 RepID=UPI003CCD79E9
MALEYPKIDVHAHYLPEVYREYYLKYGPTTPDGMPGWWDWDADDHLKMADSLNITKSYLSVTSPGVRLVPGDDELARDLARKVNVAGAEVKRAHPDRFGLFLSLPLPDVESSLGELAYGMDHLDADGVVVLTNGDGYYLGHQRYEPLWAELDRRAAVVFIHPTTGRIVESTVDSPEGNSSRPVAPLPEYANPIFEFFFDTTRAVINLFYTGAIARYPNIKYIVAHAGACLPPLIQRFAELARIHQPMTVDASVSPDFVKERLRRQFFFDLAGFPFPDQLRGLLPFVGADQILYGTDYSPATADEVRRLAGIMAEYLPVIFNKEEQEMVYSKNAERLFQK